MTKKTTMILGGTVLAGVIIIASVVTGFPPLGNETLVGKGILADVGPAPSRLGWTSGSRRLTDVGPISRAQELLARVRRWSRIHSDEVSRTHAASA